NGQLAIGAGVTVKGGGGVVGYDNVWGGPSNVSVVNQGTVGPDRPGTIYLAGASWANSGTLQATGGGTLNFQATAWSNTGLITETNSRSEERRVGKDGRLRNYTHTGGKNNMTGTLENTVSKLALTAANGPRNGETGEG